MINKIKRTKQEIVLLILSFGAALSIVPFIFFRLIANDYINGMFDVLLLFIFVSTGIYIYLTREVEKTRIVLACLSVAALLTGMYLNGVDRISWTYPSLLALFFAVRPKLAAVMCVFCILITLVILTPAISFFHLTTYLVTLTTTCVFAYTFALTTVQQREKLVKLSRRDPLTSVRNRRAFDEKLDEVTGKYREEYPPSIIIVDIDLFKIINDQYGHAVGDKLLIEISQLICSRLRKQDRFYRIGGEEFAIIILNIKPTNIDKICEDIRLAVQNSDLILDHQVTISLGSAQYIEHEDKSAWATRADKALYQAKSNGRNLHIASK